MTIKPGTWCWIIRLPDDYFGRVLNGRPVEVIGPIDAGFCPIRPHRWTVGRCNFTLSGVVPEHLLPMSDPDPSLVTPTREEQRA